MEPLLKLDQCAQRALVVVGQRDGNGPFLAVADRRPRRGFDVSRERGPAPGRLEVEGEERNLAVVNFGYGREHPRRNVRRACSRFGVHDDGVPSALRETPRHGQADGTAADDDHVVAHRAPASSSARRSASVACAGYRDAERASVDELPHARRGDPGNGHDRDAHGVGDRGHAD